MAQDVFLGLLAAANALKLLVGIVAVEPQVGRARDTHAGPHHLEHKLLLRNVDDDRREIVEVARRRINVLV